MLCYNVILVRQGVSYQKINLTLRKNKFLLLLTVKLNKMSNGIDPRSSSKKNLLKKITTEKEVKKETKSVPITVELNILKVLISERSLISLLRILKKNKELQTRELLITMGSWDTNNLY